MSPEQALGRQSEVRETSDVYSLGATLYFLLTGKPPFDAGSVVKTCLAVIHDPLVPPSKHNRTVSPDLERVVLRAMAKDSTRRYPSARAFAEDLDRYMQGTPVLSDEELRFTTGLAALHAGHLEEAVDMFKDLLRHDPSGREPSEARARLIRDLRETEEALTLALDSQPKNHEIRANRGAYRFARAILSSLGGGDPLPDCALALEDFGRVLEGRPEHVNSRVSRANILTFQARFGRNSGKETAAVYHRALDDLDVALHHDGSCSAAWHNRGIVHFYLGRDARKGSGEPAPHYERAIADFRRGAEVAPNYAYLFKDLGVVKVALGKMLAPKGGARVEEIFRGAREDLDVACRLHPSLHGAFYTRGQAKFALRDYKGAVKDFRRCIEIEPGRDETKLKGLIAEAEGHEKAARA
jgi:tetratricopeptide (TPR) repeat protein